MALVLALRHAQAENPGGLAYGRLPGFALSREGREAAGHVARLLAPAPVVAVYASPLERARETAEILASPHGLEVIVDERLLEWIGREEWQGMVWDELIRTEEYIRLEDDPVGYCPQDPLDRVGERVLAWTKEAATSHEEGIVLGVSHEAPLAAAYLVGRGRPLPGYRAVHIPHLHGVRLEPGPPELVEPGSVLHAC